MKVIFRKLVPIIVIASILLSACGGPPQIDDIRYTDPENVQGLSYIDNDTNAPEPFILPLPVPGTVPSPLVIDADIFEINCGKDEYETNAETCRGDNQYGFDTVDGVFFVHIDGECYQISSKTSENDITAIKNAVSKIEELKKGRVGDIGLGLFAGVGGYSAYMGATSAGCITTAGISLGAGCIPVLLGVAAGIGISLIELYRIVDSYIQINKQKKFIENMINTGSLSPCGGE